MHVLAKHLSQRSVEQMRRGVIALGVAPTISRHGRPRFPKLYSAKDFSERGDASVDFADFVDVDAPSLALDLAAIGHLPARFDIKRRFTKDHGRTPVRQIPLCDYLGSDVQFVVAGKCCRAVALCPS